MFQAKPKPLATRLAACLLAMSLTGVGVPARARDDHDGHHKHHRTESPIKHVIVLIGENRTFDHIYATYVPKSRDSVLNLLSEGIIRADGSPGANFKKSQQFQAVAPFRKQFFISLNDNEKTPYTTLPQPTLNFSPMTPGNP